MGAAIGILAGFAGAQILGHITRWVPGITDRTFR